MLFVAVSKGRGFGWAQRPTDGQKGRGQQPKWTQTRKEKCVRLKKAAGFPSFGDLFQEFR